MTSEATYSTPLDGATEDGRGPDHHHGPQPTDRGRLASAVSNAVVRLFAEYFGRGPTKARAVVTSSAVMVILEETLTKAERKMAEAGLADSVRETRRLLQDTMREEMIAAIEDLTGRHVVGFLSDHQLDPDIAMESFVFERHPESEDGARRG
jgi:uncharacterized protein YbcI